MKKDKHPYHSIKKPNLLGNKKAFQEFLAANMRYPQEALENKIQGTAFVKCEISDKGKVLKAHSIHKLGYGLDEEAERLCLLLKFENTVERGLKIKHSKTIKIPFVLPQEPTITLNYQTTPSDKPRGNSYNYTIQF